jgi:hypothetical protein
MFNGATVETYDFRMYKNGNILYIPTMLCKQKSIFFTKRITLVKKILGFGIFLDRSVYKNIV